MYTITYNLARRYQDFLVDKDEDYTRMVHKVAVEHILDSIMTMPTEDARNVDLVKKIESLMAMNQLSLNQMVNTKMDTISNQISTKSRVDMEQVRQLTQENKEQDEMIRTQLKQEISQLRQQNQELQQKLMVIETKATEKGNFGEVAMEEWLRSEYKDSIVTSHGKSGTKADGDLQMRLPKWGAKFISIEVKNVKNMPNNQITKSRAHAKKLKDEYGQCYLGHIIVSLGTSKVHNGFPFHVDIEALSPSLIVYVGIDGISTENMKLIKDAFNLFVQYEPIHQTLSDIDMRDGGEAGMIKNRIKALATRWKFRNEKITDLMLQLEKLRSVSNSITSGLYLQLSSFFTDYHEMCGILGIDPEKYEMSKDMEGIVREALSEDNCEVTRVDSTKQMKSKKEVPKKKVDKNQNSIGRTEEDDSGFTEPMTVELVSRPAGRPKHSL